MQVVALLARVRATNDSGLALYKGRILQWAGYFGLVFAAG